MSIRHHVGSRQGIWYRPNLYPLRLASPATHLAKATKSPIPAHTSWLANGGADKAPSPFHCLRLLDDGLANLGGAVHRRRYGALLQEASLPDIHWEDIFEDPSQPLVVDVGCGAGRFVLLAALHGVSPGQQTSTGLQFAGQPANFLGIDQHSQLMDRGNKWAAIRGLSGRCHYLAVNARTTLQDLLHTYPGPVALLAVQYPDPHYRVQRHVVQPDFVAACTSVVTPGGGVLLCSDVLSTAQHMRRMFSVHGKGAFQLSPLHHALGAVFFDGGEEVDPYLPNKSQALLAAAALPTRNAVGSQDHDSQQGMQQQTGTQLVDLPAQQEDVWSGSGWLVANPLGVPTEREVFAEQITQQPVFRVLLLRTQR